MPREVVIGGRYQLVSHLGKGGMGDVYQALDLTEDRPVAIKRMAVDRTRSKVGRSELRFRREFHTLASFDHPHIVEVYDYGVDASGPWYAMELLGGSDLREVMRERKMAPREVCSILRDVASALALLHARGLVHRDLSPRNVRIVDGRAVLFDFGVLIDAGVSGEVAGTPAYIAPEMLYGHPIDHRADLYSLGVLGYAMLTGEVPYPARELVELVGLWSVPLVHPSEYADVPEGLESLIIDLLRLEPLGRPASAAVLIDKLTALGGLEPDPELAVQPGYAPTAALVGRDAELARLEAELDALVERNESRAFYIEAESGTGKSRLLAELGIRAKLRGARCLHVDCESAVAEQGGSPFATVAEMLREAFIVMPEEAFDACEPDAPLLSRVFPTVKRRFPHIDPEAESGEPAEDRMRLQRAVLHVVQRLALSGPLVLLVDDVQRCDEASAAALASLVHRKSRGLLLGVARRLRERVRATAAVAALSTIETRILLEGLDEAGVEALLRSLFGDASHVGRLAKQMSRATEGSPLLCAELARHFVENGTIRYANGTWVLPKDIPEALPDGLAAAMQTRVAALPPIARSVGEVLAVHGGEMELERCVALIEGLATDASDAEARAFVAIAELRRHGVLVDLGDRFRFRHDSMREALVAGVDVARLEVLHRHVGETLLAEGEPRTASLQAAIGWHLYYGGRTLEGAELLEKAGRALYEAQALSDCIAPLEVALEVANEHGKERWRRAELTFFLLSAGWVSHRVTGWRYARPALALLADECGLSLARSIRFIGWLPAFVVGFAWANLRWLARLGRGPTPLRLLTAYAVGLSYSCALAYAANLKAELGELIAVYARPFKAFRGMVPNAAYLAGLAMSDIIEGRLQDAAARLTRCVELITRTWLNPLTADEKRLGEAGARSMRVLVDVNQFNDERLFADLKRMEELDLRFYDLAAQTARVVRHRYRGEEKLARQIERDIEEASLQLGSWSTELQVVLFAHAAYGFTHDVEGLKQSLDSLSRYRAEGMAFDARIGVTEGEIHRERGEYDQAFAVLERTYAALDASDALMRQFICSALAQTALEAYWHDVAKRWALEGLEVGEPENQRVWLPRLRCIRALALAEDALGERESAVARLEEAIAKAESMQCPPLAGELHEAMARVCLADGDRLGYEAHLAKADAWLRPTENPGLIAVVERLIAAGEERPAGRKIRPSRRKPVTRSSASTMDAETIGATPSAVSREDTALTQVTVASKPAKMSEAPDATVISEERPLQPELDSDELQSEALEDE